jgi:hypothetical protein
LGTPRPPSNPDQRDIARRVLKQVRATQVPKGANLMNDDEAIFNRSPASLDNGKSDIGYMVVGAPGTGKSHTVATISFFIAHENLGDVLSSAFTGVATTQVILACKNIG